MSVLLLQTGGTDNLLLMDASNLLLQDSGASAFKVAWARNANTIIQPLVSA